MERHFVKTLMPGTNASLGVLPALLAFGRALGHSLLEV